MSPPWLSHAPTKLDCKYPEHDQQGASFLGLGFFRLQPTRSSAGKLRRHLPADGRQVRCRLRITGKGHDALGRDLVTLDLRRDVDEDAVHASRSDGIGPDLDRFNTDISRY